MIRYLLTCLLLASQFIVLGQSCDDSGAAQCIPVDSAQGSGLSPTYISFSPFVNDKDTFRIIQFKAFDSVYYNNIFISVDSVRMDSIGNLPNGICWSSNKVNNRFAKNEAGCIKFKGRACSDPGQYKLRLLVTLYTSNGTIGPFFNAETVGLKYHVRLINCVDNIVPVDTSQVLPFTKHPGYSSVPICSNIPDSEGCPTIGIHEVNGINALSIVPNPFSNKAVVSFTSDNATVMTERVTNMLGAVVAKNTINVKAGENSSVIDGTNLNAGVYFYSLTDGKNSITKRVVVSE